MTAFPGFSAVVAAAGAGRRLASTTPKQYFPLAGRSVLEHSVARLLAMASLRHLVLVVAAGDARWQSLALLADPRVRVVSGGAERADSVLAGLEALSGELGEDDWLLVHDVARPCVPQADLHRLLTTVAEDPVGGLLALPVSDTVKRVADGRVEATLERGGIWRAQTPQMFRYALLHRALRAALAAGAVVTDEASAMEWAGHSPRVVAGSAANLKITLPEDLELATFYLQQELSAP